MNAVAIIPARGGSKGIKDKNLQEVGGVSLVGRAIRSAKLAQKIQEVYVSTDSPVIAEEAKRWGAKTIARPPEISTDESSSESAIQHAMGQIGETSIIVFIQCTSPFIKSTEIDRAVEMIESDKYDSVFSAVEDHGFRWQENGDGLEPLGHNTQIRPRRQELPNRFLETGAFYAFRSEGFLNAGSRFHGRVGHVLLNKFLHVDIDEDGDIRWARQISKTYLEQPVKIRVKGLVMDFDGVHTDDYVWVDSDGKESVRVSRSDGHGISLLKNAGIEILILSTEINSVVETRANKLGVEVITGRKTKAAALEEWAKSKEISLHELAYLGNETNDLDAMKLVGFPIAVSDANPEIINVSAIVLRAKGGEKAVREVAGIIESIG